MESANPCLALSLASANTASACGMTRFGGRDRLAGNVGLYDGLPMTWPSRRSITAPM